MLTLYNIKPQEPLGLIFLNGNNSLWESSLLQRKVNHKNLSIFCKKILKSIGTNQETVKYTVSAIMHGSQYGIDSHGVRLLHHYVKAFEGGRINKKPKTKFYSKKGESTGVLDADDGHGAVGTYKAVNEAVKLATKYGIGAIAITNSSHFGPAGAYAKNGADQDQITIVFGNSDSFVSLFDGSERFHGTNPIAVAVPTDQKNPWLLDMATSSVPFNKIELHRSLKKSLPKGVALDSQGEITSDPNIAHTLTPLGGSDFGYKGAGLAGIAEIFSSVLTGMRLSPDIPSMLGPNFSTPRKLGAFVICLKPTSFVTREIFLSAIHRYIRLIGTSESMSERKVMVPGEREWRVFEERMIKGIPLDPQTEKSLYELSIKYDTKPPWIGE